MHALGKFYRGLAAIPLVFLGIGVQRAWSTLLFDTSHFPMFTQESYLVGMVCTVVVNFLLALWAPRLCPLYRQKWLVGIVVAFACGGSLCIVLDSLFFATGILTLLGTLLAMSATGATMLIWCEFFGSLGVTQVALYYSAAIVLGELLTYFFGTIDTVPLGVLVVAMPLVNVAWAVDASQRLASGSNTALEESRRLADRTRRVTYPYELVLLMAVISFLGGFYSSGSVSTPGLAFIGGAIVPLLIVVAVISESRWFSVDRIYRILLPLVIVAMILLMPGIGVDGAWAGALFNAGDVGMAVVIMIVFSGISFRYGINPVRLNGIERGIRYTAYLIGSLVSVFLVPVLPQDTVHVLSITLAIVAVILVLVLFMTNNSVLSRWGSRPLAMRTDLPQESEQEPVSVSAFADDASLKTLACESLGKRYGFTVREQEVAILLARKRTNLQIEKELVIAQGTLKAHINHIYTKLGVHTRAEFMQHLDKEERELFG